MNRYFNSSSIYSYLRIYLPAVISILGLAIFLLPLLLIPHVSDDVVNSSSIWLSPSELIQSLVQKIKYWFIVNGRIHILAIALEDYTYLLFSEHLQYKTYLIILNVLSASIFYFYIKAVSKNNLIAVMSIMFLPLLIQFRDYHDPIISFNGLMQLTMISISITLFFHLKYVGTKKTKWLIFSLLSFIFGLTLYEIVIIIPIFVFTQEWFLRLRRMHIKSAMPSMIFISILYFVIGRIGKWVGQNFYDIKANPTHTYDLTFDLSLTSVTFFKQIVASLPFTYSIFQPLDGNWGIHAMADFKPWLASCVFFQVAPLFIVTTFFIIFLLSKERLSKCCILNNRNKIVLSFALGLIVFPALIIAVVGRYHNVFGLGNGHLPVYFQIYGVSLLISFIVLALWRRYEIDLYFYIFSLLIGIVISGNFSNNIAVAKKLEDMWTTQYVWLELLHNLHFRELCEGVSIVIPTPAPWTDWTTMRSVTRAGFTGLSLEQFENLLKGSTHKFSYCVVVPETSLGRVGYLYAKFARNSNDSGRPVSKLYYIYPVLDGETIANLDLMLACETQGVTTKLITWWHGSNNKNYSLFSNAGGEEFYYNKNVFYWRDCMTGSANH